jgi:transcriptional regulator with XRE-family HTH domain
MECATAKGRRLLMSIQKSGMNLTDVAKRTGISRSTIYNFCHNDMDMSSNRLFVICDTVHCSMDYVMKGKVNDISRTIKSPGDTFL